MNRMTKNFIHIALIFFLHQSLPRTIHAEKPASVSKPSRSTSPQDIGVQNSPSRPEHPTSLTLSQQDLQPIQARLSEAHKQLKKQQLTQAENSLERAEKLWYLWVLRYGKPLYLTHPRTLSMRRHMDLTKRQIQQALRNKQAYRQRRCPQSTEHFPDEDNELYLGIKNLPDRFRIHQKLSAQTTIRLQHWRIVRPITQSYNRQQRHVEETAQVEGCLRSFRHTSSTMQDRCYRIHGIYRRNSVAAHWSLWKLLKLHDIVKVPCQGNR